MRITHLLLYLAVSAFWCLCYLNSLHGDFAYDDGAAIKKNSDVTAEGPFLATLSDIFTNDFWGQSLLNETSHKSYRPLTTLSFRLNWVLTGEDTFYFHIVNLICHIIVSALVGILSFSLLGELPSAQTHPNLHLRASLWYLLACLPRMQFLFPCT